MNIGDFNIDDLVWIETSKDRPDRYQCRVMCIWSEWITVIHPIDATWKNYFFICTLRPNQLPEQYKEVL